MKGFFIPHRKHKTLQLWTWYVSYPFIKQYLNLCDKTNKCTCIKYVLSHIINYQHISIAFSIITSVGLQEYQEHNKLSSCINRTTQPYNSCL